MMDINAGNLIRIAELEAEVERLRKKMLLGAERINELEANNAKLVAERDNWINSAEQHLRNEEFYRDIVCRIGDTYGEEARTSDDGIVHEDVLVLKVLELATQPK